ncbi:MAG: transposase [Verrucomicrobiota bacterium]
MKTAFMGGMEVTDAQWYRIRHHFPEEGEKRSKPGPKSVPACKILEAVMWILKTRAQWHMLPQSLPNYKTVHRRFQRWCDSEVLRSIFKDLAIVDLEGLPTAIAAASNKHHEVKLVQLSLDLLVVEVSPERLIGDAAYDSDELDETLAQQGIEMIAPHKKNRKRKPTQDKRMLRRMGRRFSVERTFAWMRWSRRLTSRWEFKWLNFLGFIELSALQLDLR